MIPIVDARSGKVVRVGETVMYPKSDDLPQEGFKLEALEVGLFSARARLRIWGLDGKERVAVVPAPIRYFPKLTYGPQFPVDGLRVAILPS